VAEQAAAKIKAKKVPKDHFSTPDAPTVLSGAITLQGLTADEMGSIVSLRRSNLEQPMSALGQKPT